MGTHLIFASNRGAEEFQVLWAHFFSKLCHTYIILSSSLTTVCPHCRLKIKMKIAIYSVFLLVCLGSKVKARPQVNLLIDTGISIEEVVKPEDKQRILDEFQGKSILYQSLPSFQGEHPINIEVESPTLVLTKPKDRSAKRNEKAEKRTQLPKA